MKKISKSKKPFRRRTRKNKGSRKIKGGGLGWDNAINIIYNNTRTAKDTTLTEKDTKFKFIGPVIPNSDKNEYFIARASVTKSFYSFATIELTAENYNSDGKLTTFTNDTAVRLNKLNICKIQASNAINLVKIAASYRRGQQLNCNILNIYKPAVGRSNSNWFWNEWLQDIKIYNSDDIFIDSS